MILFLSATFIAFIRLAVIIHCYLGYCQITWTELMSFGFKQNTWANIQVELAIVCGKYKSTISVLAQIANNIDSKACLPTLKPILSFVQSMLSNARQQAKDQHRRSKKGSELLQNMMLRRKSKSITISRSPIGNQRDLEAANRQPDVDPSYQLPRELHGVEQGIQEIDFQPILEMDIIESRNELASRGLLPELPENGNNYKSPALQKGERET